MSGAVSGAFGGKLVQYDVNHSENLVGAMLYQPLGKFGWYTVI